MRLAADAKKIVKPIWGVVAKAHLVRRRAYLTGAYQRYSEALSAAPSSSLAGYSHEEVVSAALENMCKVLEWDYPVMFWLSRTLTESGGGRFRLLDAGGHIGTKFLAFQSCLDLSAVDWIVYDLPPMVAAGRRMAETKGLKQLTFVDSLGEAEPCDLLLCSGLLQYLDVPFSELLGQLRRRPKWILLNKVAVREGTSVYTLQRVGPAYVPYQIRNQGEFLAELEAAGYEIVDRWEISSLSHRIASHPELGRSRSIGYMLRARASWERPRIHRPSVELAAVSPDTQTVAV